MWKWARNAQKNGGRITEQDKVEIRGAFSMELGKLPVPKDGMRQDRLPPEPYRSGPSLALMMEMRNTSAPW